jgi:hypothetical protein
LVTSCEVDVVTAEGEVASVVVRAGDGTVSVVGGVSGVGVAEA